MARDGDDHLIALIGMMGSSTGAGDGEGVNAYRVASRALAKRGITWRDLAERALRTPPTPPRGIWQGDPSSRQQQQRREERRDERARERAYSPPPPPPPPQQPKPKPRRSSHGVPAAIGGVISVIDDDRRSGIVVFEIDGKEAVFGPILAHRGAVRDNIVAGNGRYATMRIRPPRQEGSMPVAVACSTL
jgi:hypothetical protein